jgi:hypothetical protein
MLPRFEVGNHKAPEISTLIDYASSYENVEKLQPFPLDHRSFFRGESRLSIPLIRYIMTGQDRHRELAESQPATV